MTDERFERGLKTLTEIDGETLPFFGGVWAIFGHGNVAGLGQALDQLSDIMPFVQGRNEQSLAHLAIGYGKALRRHATLAVTASIGLELPGVTFAEPAYVGALDWLLCDALDRVAGFFRVLGLVPPADADLVRAEVDPAPAETGDPLVECHPRPQARLLEEQRDRSVGQGTAAVPEPMLLAQPLRSFEHPLLPGRVVALPPRSAPRASMREADEWRRSWKRSGLSAARASAAR